jgi:probable F420-dependent oxidoreductase
MNPETDSNIERDISTAPTPRPFRFGVQGGPFGDLAALREHARNVEALGYDELFTSDHIGAPDAGGQRGAMFIVDPFIPLVVVAESTTTLRVGPLVLNNEFYNPALLARTVATIDRLTGGRLVLGLGTGYASVEHDSIGTSIRAPGPRVSRFEESLDVLRALLDHGAVDHEGEHESVHIDDLGVTPVQHRVPFLIGGHGARVVRLAAAHADIFQFTGLTHGSDGTPGPGGFPLSQVAERGRWLTEAAGDRDASIERSALVQFTSCDDSRPPTSELADRFGVAADVVESTPFLLSGSVGQIVDKIERLRDQVGITHYVVRDAEGFAPVVEALAR